MITEKESVDLTVNCATVVAETANKAQSAGTLDRCQKAFQAASATDGSISNVDPLVPVLQEAARLGLLLDCFSLRMCLQIVWSQRQTIACNA